MTWMGRHRGLAIGVAVVLAIGLGVAWYVNQSVAKSFLSYWVVDDRTIGVQAIDGRDATCWLASSVESTTDIRVDVRCHPQLQLGAGTAEGYPYEFQVPLTSPLGERAVVDATGNASIPCVAPRCGASSGG